MEELLVKVWDKRNKVMREVIEIDFWGDRIKVWDDECLGWMKMEDLILLLGFQDKNGQEFYEGDVVEDLDGKKYLVYWDEYMFRLKGFYDGSFDNPTDAFSEGIFKVIGNIYENPELLKQVEEV